MTSWQLPLVAVFGLVTVLLVRGREMPAWQAVVVGLFGYYLAQSPVSGDVSASIDWLLRGVLHT